MLIYKYRQQSPTTEPLIIGAAGNNGLATIESLVKKQLPHTKIRAAVRSEEKATALTTKYPNIPQH